MQMTQDVLIAFYTFSFTVFVFSVELRAYVLPCSGGQYVTLVVENSRWERAYLVQSVLELLEMLYIDKILKYKSHDAPPVKSAIRTTQR